MALSFSTPPIAFGLSLSDRTLKVAQLRRRRRGITVDVAVALELPLGVIEGGEFKDVAVATAAIAKALEPFRKTLAPGVIAAIPERRTFVQTINVPKKEGAAFATQLTATLPQYLPVPIDDVYHDAAVVSETPATWKTLVGAVPRPVIDAYLQVLESLGFVPFALEGRATAIARAVIPSHAPARTIGIVSLSRQRGYLVVHDGSTVQFTLSLPVAGDDVTKRIAASLKLSYEQAEKAKLACGLDPRRCEGVLPPILDDIVATLVAQLKQAREFYQDHFPGARDFDEVLLCGGAGHLYSLDQVLERALGVPVRLADVWQNVALAARPALEVPLRYATVVGLALRGLDAEPTL